MASNSDVTRLGKGCRQTGSKVTRCTFLRTDLRGDESSGHPGLSGCDCERVHWKGQNNEPLEARVLVDRRQFLNFATASTVATAVHPFETEQKKKHWPQKNSTVFAFQQVDVFSSKPLLGNPLAVVIGADALSDEQMAAFASWTNLSETTFLLEPKSPDADYRVRIFTRQREVPFAGHPTLGSCHVWLAVGGVAKGREIVQECGLGLIHIRRAPERLSFVAPKLVRSGPVEPEVLARVVRGLDLAPDAIMASNWVDNGSGWLAIMLRSREGVLALRPNYSTLTGLKVGVFAAFNPLKDGNSAQFEVRAFSVEDVGHEDPVTGSLNAGLAQWLIGSRIAPSEYVVSQGTVLKRMGRVYIEQNGFQIWVGGTVRTCVIGKLML
jgi:PhzF family phenazine biosynthesis protein